LTFNNCLLLKIVKYASECPIDEQNYRVSSKRGRETCLKSEDEKAIVDWVLNMASDGFPIPNKELLDSIQYSLNRANRITTFKNNRPTLQSIPRFRKRHNLSLRFPETLDGGNASVTLDDIRKWFDRVKTYLKLVLVPLCPSTVELVPFRRT
jgi:hypothetical protein